MLLTMIVTLYTSRVVLNALGAQDFGIFNVVGGIVVMFSVLNSSMAAATSRFLIFELGKKNQNQLRKVFSASLLSHLIIAFIVMLLAQTIGMWFLNNKLVIPADRNVAAIIVFQFSIFTTMINLTQVPYNSLIIAHERMDIYAYVSILEAVLKLLIAYLLTISLFDKLIFYSILVFIVSLTIATIYRVYCRRNFPESAFKIEVDKDVYRSLFSFSVWELYGGFAFIGMGQGLNMLLNIFFGPVVNAARGIAYQVQGAIGGFGSNFMIAIKPKIVRLFAEGKLEQMMSLVFSASKYSFYLTFFLTLPLILEADYVLKLWLNDPPIYTTSFVRLILVNNLIISMRGPIITAFHAAGNIKMANLIGGSLYYFTIFIAYLCLKSGLTPNSVFIATIIVTIIVQINIVNFHKGINKFQY